MRMKRSMHEHVLSQEYSMFDNACNKVRDELRRMVRAVDETMATAGDEVFVAMSRDSRAVLGGEDISEGGEAMPKWQRDMRKRMMAVILKAETVFKKASGLIPDDEPALETTEGEIKKDEHDDAASKSDERAGSNSVDHDTPVADRHGEIEIKAESEAPVLTVEQTDSVDSESASVSEGPATPKTPTEDVVMSEAGQVPTTDDGCAQTVNPEQ